MNTNRMDDHLFCQKRIFEQYRYDAKSRHLPFKISFKHFIKYLTEPCYYCGDRGTCVYTDPRHKERKFKYNGIDRMDNTKGYIKDNLLPCCRTCNWMKKGMPFYDFIFHVYKIIQHRSSDWFRVNNKKGVN